jgi:hypothetical protein
MWLPLAPMTALAIAWKQESRTVSGHGEPPASVRWRNALLVGAVPFLVVPIILTIAYQPRAWATLTFGSAYFWGTLLLWAGTVADWRRAGRRSSDGPVTALV